MDRRLVLRRMEDWDQQVQSQKISIPAQPHLQIDDMHERASDFNCLPARRQSTAGLEQSKQAERYEVQTDHS